MDASITALLSLGAIETCQYDRNQFLSGIFLVPKPNGEYRFIFNLKNLNRYIANQKFKMEDFRTALRIIEPNCLMATLDLKDAYFLISIHTNDRKYLRFVWKRQLFQFTCLPFGLCTGPRIFTKIMKPVVGRLRSIGYRSVNYLDDLFLLGSTYDLCRRNCEASVELLHSLGFVVNMKKSCLKPTTDVKISWILN